MVNQRVFVVLLLVGLGLPAMAQSGGDEQAEAGLLSGPAVDAAPTLVRYGLDGRLERIEGRPEIAAAELLLDADEATALARVRVAAAERLDALRMLLVDEIDAVRVISDLSVAGETQAAREELQALWSRFEPNLPHAPLIEVLADVVGPSKADALRSMVDEYLAAMIAERMGERLQRRLGVDARMDEPSSMDTMTGGMPGQRVDPQVVMASKDPVIAAVRERLAFEMFQREVRYAYDQSLARYRELLESIDSAVEPTAAQRSAIREIVLEHIRETRLEATPAQRRATMLAIYRQLDDDRRERLYALLLRQVVPG